MYRDVNRIKVMINKGHSRDEVIKAMSRNYTAKEVEAFLPKKTRKKTTKK